MASRSNIFSPGDLIEDRYRVVRLVGIGGMGEVYEAESLESGGRPSEGRQTKRVAIKTVLPELLGNHKIIARFEREAELSRRISHPNVLRIFEVLKIHADVTSRASGATGDPGSDSIPCMVMELLIGETVADLLIDGRTVEPGEGVALACQMAAALTAAHRAGVVHRDLKPDNVFLVPENGGTRVVLTDFGVARRSTAPPRDDSLTASNVLLGTPDYMAPEQLELEQATPASDIYTMGLVLFEMLTGKRPFVADTALKMVFKRVQEEPPSPRVHLPDLDPRWEEVILRCLARKPEDRFEEAQDIIRVLEGERSQLLVTAPDDRLRRLVPWLVAAVVAAGFAAAVLWL